MAQGDFKFTVSEVDYARLTNALEELSEIEQNVALKRSFKQGSEMLLSAGKASYLMKNKKITGNLYRSFTDKLKSKKRNISGIYVGFRRGKGLGNHAHLIDKGTTHRYTKKGYYRGKIDQPGPGARGYVKTGKTYFWSSVVSSRGEAAMQEVVDALYRAIKAIKG